MSEELKPCPFCGSPAKLWYKGERIIPKEDESAWDIRCINNECYLSQGGDWYLFINEVIKLWNTRPEGGEEG